METIVQGTYASEISAGMLVQHDFLHAALGESGLGGARIGINPVREGPNTRTRLAWETWMEVRYYNLWNKRVDPKQAVDPRTISDLAARLMNAIASGSFTKSGRLWFFNVENLDYPNDPTDNKTRYVMTIRAWANNTSLTETTG